MQHPRHRVLIHSASGSKLVVGGIRYGRPGLQTQITYLAGMTTRVDQRIGADAVERYQILRKDLTALEGRVTQVLGPEAPARVVP